MGGEQGTHRMPSGPEDPTEDGELDSVVTLFRGS